MDSRACERNRTLRIGRIVKSDATQTACDRHPRFGRSCALFSERERGTRSSYYFEDAATEFQVQGLELDWVCVAWCGDFRFTDSGWSYHDFRGDRWCNIANPDNRIYLRNAYRVLLTRARQGMVVFVPPGDASDPTRSPAFFDSTFDYLKELGKSTRLLCAKCNLQNGAAGIGDIEGKVARVAASELGNERVSNQTRF